MAGLPKTSPQASAGSLSSPDSSASTPQSGSWSGTRPVADNTPAAPLEPQQGIQPRISSAMPATILRVASAIEHQGIAAPAIDGSVMTSASSSAAVAATPGDSTGFKIRIPRDLPNLPDAFRKLGATRSQPSTSPSSKHSPASWLASRSRSVGSEPLYQTKLVLSHQGAVGHTKRGNTGMTSDETQASRSYHTLGQQAASDKRLKSTKSETGSPSFRQIDSPNPNAPTTPIIMRESKAPWTLLNFVRSSEAQSSASKALSNPTSKIAPSPTLHPPSPSGTSPMSNIALESILNSASPPTVSPATDNTAAGGTKRKGVADVPTNNHLQAKRPRSHSRSKSDSPTPAILRFPTPTSLSGGTVADAEDAAALVHPRFTPPVSSSAPPTSGQQINMYSVPVSTSSSHTHETRLTDTERAVTLTGESNVINAAPSVMSMTPDPSESSLTPLEMVRVGTTILDLLLSNPVSRNFVNKVPLAVTNYHAVIKKPMDLVTIEEKLWKSLDIYQSTSSGSSTPALVAATGHLSVPEGYSGLQDFERDLRRIYLNAIYFNSPQDHLYKEAQQFEALYTGILLAYREHRLIPNPQLPQELYTPSFISLSEPGPIYLFRAHQVREMERKMTDLSVELYAAFHQPLIDIMYGPEQLSTEKPRFARMYITKHRRLLANCRDEKNAKLVILSGLQNGKPYLENKSTSPGGTTQSGGSTKMINIKARIMIAKPIGERHEMITVGDLDCPSAWIMVVCVKAFDIDVDVPCLFEKGTLAKMRHDAVPFGVTSKISPRHQQIFLNALGIKLPPNAGQRSVQPAAKSIATESKSLAPAADANLVATSSNVGAVTTTSSSTSATHAAVGQAMASISEGDAQNLDRPRGSNAVAAMEQEPIALKSTLMQVPASLSSASSSMSSVTSLKDHTIVMGDDSDAALQISGSQTLRTSTQREQQMLRDLKVAAQAQHVPYISWSAIEPTLSVDSAQGLFKRIYHVQGNDGLVVQNFKEMDAESFEQRVREVVCLLKLRGSGGVGQIQSIIDDEMDHLVGLSMTKYAYTLKAYATSARRHPSPCQKLVLIRNMIEAISAIHSQGLAHRDLSEVNIMVDEDPVEKLEDSTPRPWIRVIDFGKSVFLEPEEVKRWSIKDTVPAEELALLPLVVLPPDHGYKLYRSILTLPRTKFDQTPLPPVNPQLEDVYSLGVLIWRTFSGKSPWNGAIEDDIKTIRYLVKSDDQIKFQIEREVSGKMSQELLLKCLTAEASTRWTAHRLKEWVNQPEVSAELLREFEALGGGRKRVRKNLD